MLIVNRQQIYFPNLNGLRFIAALLVIVAHIEQLKSLANFENYYGLVPFIAIIGKLGVILFFVLSGFLITYLLLTEEQCFKSISVKQFYIRRIIRIWPLYFLIIFFAFVILPNISILRLPGYGKQVIYKDLLSKITLYIAFFPNLVLSIFGIVPYASHTWSIGTEEQYYLVWPVILNYFKKHRLILMLCIIISYLLIDKILSSHLCNSLPYRDILKQFWLSFNIDCMAIGGVFAILYFQKNSILKVLLNNYVFYVLLILVVVLIIKGVYFPYFHYEIYSLFFGIIILNFATNDKIKITLENRYLNFLGKISYGIYMYHPICIVLVLVIANSINLKTNYFIYPISLLVTVALASLSYKYFESFFLKFKARHSFVISGK